MRRLVIFGLTAAALAGYADTVTLTKGDSGGTSTSFNSAGNWSDATAPHEGADYLVAPGVGAPIRTPDTNSNTYSATFKGDSLTIGVIGGDRGRLIHKSRDNCIITHHNLIWANGIYAHGVGGVTATVNGNAIVTSPEAAPFQIQGSGNGGERKFKWNVAMTGEAGTMFEVSRTSGENDGRFLCDFGGDNTGYLGKMQVVGSGIYLRFNNANSVGGPLETFTPDAIILKNKGGFGLADTDKVVIARENGGITVDASGGVLFVGNAATFTGTFQMPITGEGAVEKLGVGTAVFDAAWTAGDLTVSEGAFGFTPDTTVGGNCSAFTVTSVATFSATQAQLEGKTMTNAGAFNPAGIGTVGAVTLGVGQTVTALMFDVSGADCDTVTLTDAATVTAWPMKIGLTGYGSAARYAVLQLPVSLKAVTAEDFTDVSMPDPSGFLTTSIAVERDDETGIQTVYLCQSFPIVNQIVNDKYFTDAAAWEDGLAAHAGAVYVTYAKLLRTSAGTANDVTFPGESLYLYSDTGTRADLRIKDKSLTVNDLRMGPRSIITAGAGSSGVSDQTLYGEITISGISGQASVFATEQNRTFTVAANLHGSGHIAAISYSGSTRANFILSGDNSDFTGSWQIGETGGDRPSSYPTVHIVSKANLGGNPASRNAIGLQLYGCGVLVADDSLTLDDPNRVVEISNGFLDVPEGKTLTITSETVWKGNLTKTGAGILAMGNAKRTSNSKTLHVKEGFFKPLTVETVGTLQLIFYDGSGYLLDKDPEDALLGEFGLVDSNASAFTLAEGLESLPVAIDFGEEKPHGGFRVPLFTINAAAAAKIRDHITVTNCPKSYTVSIVEETATWTSGTDFQRFSAVFKDIGGTVILMQ